MRTISEPFALSNASSSPAKRGGFRVPFGLKDGRVWAPAEVAKGKACGCICPGCHAPVAAKAQESRRKRPHFAHLTDTGCHTGLETGIHLRAKQLIADHQELAIPAWVGDLVDMPNPPQARDVDGILHLGRRIDHPARLAELRDIELERSLGAYQPDVYANDQVGELLIEIRVTHAVDDRKAARVQLHGRRMVEIDLSQMDRDTPHNLVAFEQAVLFDTANRSWIACPDAALDWHESKRVLDEQVATRNQEIAQQRDRLLQATQARREQETREAKDKAGRTAYVRRTKRAKHDEDLAQLIELTSPTRIEQILRDYQVIAEDRVGALLNKVSPAVRCACLRAHWDAWVFGVDPALWQLLAYDHFIARHPPETRFNQKDVAAWVRRSFHPEKALYRLFVTQYANQAELRKLGYFPRSLDYWVFTEEENKRIPSFYAPINDFIDRLEAARLIRRLPAPTGEREILKPPTAGLHPVAGAGYPPNPDRDRIVARCLRPA